MLLDEQGLFEMPKAALLANSNAAGAVAQGALLRGESGATAVLADLQAEDAMAAQLLVPEAASSPAAHAAGSPRQAVRSSTVHAFADTTTGAEAADHAVANALAPDSSMPQALSLGSLAPTLQPVVSTAPLSAPLTASMPQASPLAEQHSTAGTAAFAGALDAEREGLAPPEEAGVAAEADVEAGLLPHQEGAQQLVGGSRKQGLTLRPARRSSASGQQGDRNSVAKRPWK